VESHLAACCNIIPSLRSIYFWQGKLCDDSELLLVIKTKADRYELLKQKIRELHPYDVPEVIALPVLKGNKDYLKWVDENVREKQR
jgi:periplasmic divalent cation tolerance protein